MSTADERLTKSYDVFRSRPNGLILGSSDADLGLDATDSQWPSEARPVYNLGVFGVSLADNYHYLRHVLQLRHLNIVVVAVGFDSFLGRWIRPLDEQGLSRLDDPSADIRPGDLLKAALSFDALSASTDVITDSLMGIHRSYILGNHPVDLSRRDKGGVGSSASFTFVDIRNISASAVKPTAVSRLDDLRNILQLCVSNGVRVIVIIDPVHAHMLESYSQLQYWQSYENWKRNLVSLTASVQSGDGHLGLIELWDFSGYNRYTIPELPEALRWFWDSAHYTHNLGELIIRRLFVGDDDPEFGVHLAPSTVDAHLKFIRQQQAQYRKTHPDAVSRLRRILDETPH